MIACYNDFVWVAEALEPGQRSLDLFWAPRLCEITGMDEEIAVRCWWLSVVSI